jgi:hypothetical protein
MQMPDNGFNKSIMLCVKCKHVEVFSVKNFYMAL